VAAARAARRAGLIVRETASERQGAKEGDDMCPPKGGTWEGAAGSCGMSTKWRHADEDSKLGMFLACMMCPMVAAIVARPAGLVGREAAAELQEA